MKVKFINANADTESFFDPFGMRFARTAFDEYWEEYKDVYVWEHTDDKLNNATCVLCLSEDSNICKEAWKYACSMKGSTSASLLSRSIPDTPWMVVICDDTSMKDVGFTSRVIYDSEVAASLVMRKIRDEAMSKE